MQENNQNKEAEDFLRNLPLQTEEIGYQANEMVPCGKCARANPPTRLKCLYCGAELEISDARATKIKPVLRKLEIWENGFNLIYLPRGENFSAEVAARIAKLIGLEPEILQKILEARKPLPLVRCETLTEAEILRNHLVDSGVATLTVADEKLAPENPPKRLRGLDFRDGRISLFLFNNDEIEEIRAEELVLIVAGAIFRKTVESTEARKKGESKILNATETASDESLLDIYTKNDPTGYRILTKGFDFSCLGVEKGILARENLKRLAGKLRAVAPRAQLIDDYLPSRSLLGEIWEIEQRKDAQGLTRQRFGKFDLSNVVSSSNLPQFNKYSRLQWHIL